MCVIHIGKFHANAAILNEETITEGRRKKGFSNAGDAIEFADSLLEFAALEDVTKLTVLGESLGRKVYKDTMVRLQK